MEQKRPLMDVKNLKMASQQAENEAPIHGDVLEEIISHVPLLDLVPASHVSKSWRRAVASSLRRSSRRRLPWLILHLQTYLQLTTLAYDPNSRAWIPISRRGTVDFHSSHPGLLHSLSLSHLAISTDAFGANWRRLRGPKLCRDDAVVALVGSLLIVAGGTCGFEGDPLAVEASNVSGEMWEACEPMPEAFRGSASATWLSVVAGERELHVLEKREGLLCSFNSDTKRWGRVCKLSLEADVFLTAVGLAGERLVIVGASGEATYVESVTLWDVGGERKELKKIGAMPAEMVERMVGDGWGLSSSIGFSVVGGFGYVYNPSDMREVFMCEFGEERCRWSSAGMSGGEVGHRRVAFGCATVGMEELKRLFSSVGELK